MRYELGNDELAVFFSTDEMNIALSYENSMHGGHGMTSGELMYACLVDAINARTGTPAVEWRDTPLHRPESVSCPDGALAVTTREGNSITFSSSS